MNSKVMNPDLERRKEFERRKKLRLLQVRQQSKEFADTLRERIKGEVIQQKKKYAESETKLRQEKHLEELRNLKEFYERCLQSVGQGHKEAAKQPDLTVEKQAEMAKISTQANRRGVKAIKKQLKDEAHLKQKIEAPLKQKKAVRNKENLRAFFISSLPKHVEISGPRSISPPKSSQQNSELLKKERVLEEIPSNLIHCKSRVGDLKSHKSPEKPNILREYSKVEDQEVGNHKQPEGFESTSRPEDRLSDVSSPKECSCDYIVCSCHKSPRDYLRRCSSESRISSEKELNFEEPTKKTVRSRSCSPRSVRTLNYFEGGNVYESNQRSSVRVTHHSRPRTRPEEDCISNSVQDVSVPVPSVEELKKRTAERSAKALRKEKIKKDFQQLIQNLKKLSEKKSVISNKTKGKPRVFSSERDILTRYETKQKKLNDAFEKLPHCIKSSKTLNSGDKKPNESPSGDSSPPTLNLALCQSNIPPVMARRVVSSEEITLPECPSPGGNRPRRRPQPTRSSPRARSESPNVLVKRDPSGDVHITVKVSEVLGGSSRSPASPISDSSYMSPPANLTPSQQQLLDGLLCQVNKRAIGDEMKTYINKLLNMSRESIDELHGPRSRSPRSASPDKDKDIERDLIRLGELAEVYAQKVNTLVDMYEQMSPDSSGSYIDPIRAPPSRTPPSSGPRAATSGITPPPCPRTPEIPAAPTAGPCSTPRSSGSRSSISSTDTVNLFGGIPGVRTPTREEVDAISPYCPSGSRPPDNWDMEAAFDQAYERLQQLRQGPSRPSHSPGCGGDSGASEGAFGGDFGGGISLDTSAFHFPLNPEKLNAVKQKLANICNDQYHEIVVEELRKDQELENILKQATCNPFLDTNASLAPIGSDDTSYVSTEWSFYQ